MEIEFTPQAKEELEDWRIAGQQNLLKKVRSLVESIIEDPSVGIGKPEQLKHNLAGKWSRRINKEHRLVYEVSGDLIKVFSVKGHYD